MLVRNTLRRTGRVSAEHANQVSQEGWVLSIVGLIVLAIGLFLYWGLRDLPALAVVNAGGLLMPLGIAQLIQWIVYKGRGTECQVYVGAWVTALIGVALIAAYVIHFH